MPALSFDQLITKTLLQRFELEGEAEDGNGQHCGVILRDDGHIFVHHPRSPPIDSAQLLWAVRLLKLVNRELHHDGAWVVVFTHPSNVTFDSPIHAEARSAYYRRYGIIFCDKDADPQFTIEWLHGQNTELKDFAAVVLNGIESTAQKCEQAWKMAQVANQVLDRKQGETYKRARGQRAPSAQ